MTDSLLQSFKLKHLNLKNRIITTSHEPAYNEDGFPKDRYVAYHLERAKGGIAMTMTAGSTVVSKDSPPSFDNIHAYKDEVVPWIKKLTEAIHDQDCKIMIQLTHLGRRTSWSKGDWLPSISSGKHREPAHKAFPKVAESWDIERIIKEYGKDGSGGYKNPSKLLSGMKKLAQLPANNIRRLQDTGHMTIPQNPDGTGPLRIIDLLGPQNPPQA